MSELCILTDIVCVICTSEIHLVDHGLPIAHADR